MEKNRASTSHCGCPSGVLIRGEKREHYSSREEDGRSKWTGEGDGFEEAEGALPSWLPNQWELFAQTNQQMGPPHLPRFPPGLSSLSLPSPGVKYLTFLF